MNANVRLSIFLLYMNVQNEAISKFEILQKIR